MPHLLIVADDLTGAADTGACFAARGFATVIPLAGAAPASADVVVLSTETRDLGGEDAARIVFAVVARQMSSPGDAAPRWIYKKIDSALRGNPRDELLATMTATGIDRAVVAPAFPAEGRTTVGGRQTVGGVLLAESLFDEDGVVFDVVAVFANDGGPPVRVLDLAKIRDHPEHVAALLEAEPAGLTVADAETEDDLLTLAHAISASAPGLLCGTAGFARALAQILPLPPGSPSAVPPLRGAQPVLVVAGSQHDATRRQIDSLRRAGALVVHPSQGVVDGADSADELVGEVAAHLAAGQTTVLTTVGLAASPLGGSAVADLLARVVVSPPVLGSIGGLVLTGGDVTAAVCAALGATALWLGGEVAPGQPWGVLEGGARSVLPVATKAGSFGDENALLACVAFLTDGAGDRLA